MFYIYCLRNSINGKMYIGKTSSFHRRMLEHVNTAKGNRPNDFKTIHYAIVKYGWDSFEKFILDERENESEAYEYEMFWITFFNSKKLGYNETIGGMGAASGENNPMYGKTHTVEAKKAMSKKRKVELNPNFGKEHSEKIKSLMSDKKKIIYLGENNPKSKLNNIQANYIRCKFTNNLQTIKQLSVEYGVHRNVIERIIRKETYKNG